MKRQFNLNYLQILIGINVAIFLLALVLQSVLPSGNESQLGRLLGGLYLPDVASGSIWTLVTANFVHVNIIHFALNIFSLYSLGKVIQQLFDAKTLIITYLLSGILASIFTIIFFGTFNLNYISLGASGSIFGLLGLIGGSSIFYSKNRTPFPYSINDILPTILLPLLITFLGYSYINHFAHLGGLLAGLVIGYSYSVFRFNYKIVDRLAFLSLLVIILSMVLLAIGIFAQLFLA